MSSQTTARGNLLADPEIRTVTSRGEQRQICELRIMSDVWIGEGNERKQDPARTQPIEITVWGEALGQQCAEVLRKGMRIQVSGQSHVHIYRYSDAERAAGKQDIFGMRISADDVTLCLNRVGSITMRARQNTTQTNGEFDDDIPF